MLPSLLLLLLWPPTTASRPLQPLRRRTYQPKDHSSLAIEAIHRLRGGSTSCTGSGDWRFFVAGSISAAFSHGYTTPIDVIKTRMQTNPDLYDGSTILALRNIVAESGTPPPPPPLPSHTRTHSANRQFAHAPSSSSAGALFLLQGLVPTLIGYGAEGALKFGSYEKLKPLFAQLTRSGFVNYILASCVAGAIAAVVLCPAEEVRIRMVADPDYARGTAAALVRISREKGPFGSLGGFPAMAVKQVPYTMGKQVSFDFLCGLAVQLLSRSGASPALASRLAPMVAALPAAVLAAVLSQPGDVLLTEFYKGGSDGGESSSLLASLRSVLGKRGVAGLFVGLQALDPPSLILPTHLRPSNSLNLHPSTCQSTPHLTQARLVHVIGIIWVQLILYDSIKQRLGLPATGH